MLLKPALKKIAFAAGTAVLAGVLLNKIAQIAFTSQEGKWLIPSTAAYLWSLLYLSSILLPIFMFKMKNRSMPSVNRFSKAPPAAVSRGVEAIISILFSLILTVFLVTLAWPKINLFESYWLKVSIKGGKESPNLHLPEDQKSRKIIFQPYEHTYLAIKKNNASEVLIWEIELDNQPVKQEELELLAGCFRRGAEIVLGKEDCLIKIARPAREISGTIVNKLAEVNVYWLNQVKDLKRNYNLPGRFDFKLKSRWQGWVSLDYRPYEELVLVNNGSEPVNITEVALIGKKSGKEILAAPKTISPGDRAVINKKLNPVKYFRLVNISFGLFLVILGVFEIFKIAVRRFKPWILPAQTETSGSIVNFGILKSPGPWIVFACCFTYHLIYVLVTGASYSPDSSGYYKWAHQILEGASLDQLYRSIGEKGLGYPLFLSIFIGIFGDGIFIPALFQHLLVSSLSLVTLVCLSKYFSRPLNYLVALLIGLSPVISPTASLIWTESLFIWLTFSSLAFFAANPGNLMNIFISGGLTGAAVVVRPNGIITALAIGGLCLLDVLVRFIRSRTFAGFSRIPVFAMGVFAAAGLWLMNSLIVHEGSLMGTRFRKYNEWQAFLYEQRLKPEFFSSIPDKWIYAVPSAHRLDYAAFLDSYPSVISLERINTLDGMAPVYIQSSKDAVEDDPGVISAYIDTLLYHMTFSLKGKSVKHYTDELQMHLGWLDTPRNNYNQNISDYTDIFNPKFSGTEVYNFLEMAKTSFKPHESPARNFILGTSSFFIAIWGFLFFGAMAGFCACVKKCPQMLVFLLFVAATVAGYSTNIMPMQRYVAIIEPQLYVGVCLLMSLIKVRFLDRS